LFQDLKTLRTAKYCGDKTLGSKSDGANILEPTMSGPFWFQDASFCGMKESKKKNKNMNSMVYNDKNTVGTTVATVQNSERMSEISQEKAQALTRTVTRF